MSGTCGDGCCGGRAGTSWSGSGLLAALAPAIACLGCPGCLAILAQVASALGFGLALSEQQHGIVLAVAIGISLATAALRVRTLRRAGPLVVALAGCSAIAAGHFLGDRPLLEWVGVAILTAGAFVESRRHRRAQHPHRDPGSMEVGASES
jgi:hypothetical protein